MRKLILVVFSFTCINSGHAQSYADPISVYNTSSVLQGTTTPGAMQISQDDNTGSVGIGYASSSGSPNPCALVVSNQLFPTAPASAVLGVINYSSTSIPLGNSFFSLFVGRETPASAPNASVSDFSIDQGGLVGIGYPASVYFTSGAHFGIIDPDNTGTIPLAAIFTNINNSTGFNLPSLVIDYTGYVSIGAMLPVTHPAHFYLTDPNNTGTETDPLMSVVTNLNAQSLFIGYNGAVGIGTTTPGSPLDVVGNAKFENNIDVTGASYTSGNTYQFGTLYTQGIADFVSDVNITGNTIVSGKVGIGTSTPAVALDVVGDAHVSNIVYSNGAIMTGNVSTTQSVTVGGLVQIGSVTTPNIFDATTNPNGYKLYVQGGILAEQYKIALNGSTDWSDYVFDKDYKLASLNEIEQYIKANHHLPGVPSTDDVRCNGIDVGSMDATLLKKIEELTLYVLDLKKDNDVMKIQLSNLKK